MTSVVSLSANPDRKKLSKSSEPEPHRPPYTICRKRLIGAYAAELVIALTAFAGSVLLAKKYAHGQEDLYLMLLAPIVYVVVELGRVPLALSIRTNPSKAMKVVAVLGVVCAAGITTKSMSQLGEMMFRPRLDAVAEAKRNRDEAHDALARHDDAIAKAKELVEQRKVALADAEARLQSTSAAIGRQPGQTCNAVSRPTKGRGVYQVQVCSRNPATLALSRQLADAERDRAGALDNLNAANADLKRLEDPDPSKAASTADGALKDAVSNSQLHDFTAMVFGIDPVEVTDGQIHTFLRLFVFLPAILAAAASTLLAMTAVTFHPTPTSPDYRLTAEESHRVMQDALAAAAARVRSAPSPKGDEKPVAAAA